MDNAFCNVIYVDSAVKSREFIAEGQNSKHALGEEKANLEQNVKLLLDVFGGVHLCNTGGDCLDLWLALQDTSRKELKPTLILIDTPYQDIKHDTSRSRSPSPHSPPEEDNEDHEVDLNGLLLLQRIITESYLRNLHRLVVLVPVIAFPPGEDDLLNENDQWRCDLRQAYANAKLYPDSSNDQRQANRRFLRRCLDIGATDVMNSPMNGKCVTNLEVHAYRAHREAAREERAMDEVRRGRKRSWVGINEEKPFAYLRESMVSNLMNGICRVEDPSDLGAMNAKPAGVSAEKRIEIAHAVGQWHFCAHSFTDDELIWAAAVMFEHALVMPELGKWRISTEQLHSFLIACRAAYNVFVPYHNFRHVIDVLQATFHFLVRIGALPHYPSAGGLPVEPSTASAISTILGPIDALTLLITAIGHDVGHPGVNNGFLVTLNAPLAQLYNDRSVLESFHCAAYSQILRRYWPSVFGESEMRSLMISSILATDMGLHMEYMAKMENLQNKLREPNGSVGWDGRMISEQKALACALLIKCADISNVARSYETALEWSQILADEFSRQAEMEIELDIKSSLVVPPKKDMLSQCNSQLGFMTRFAIPLFHGVADLLPAMRYCVDELELNRQLFDKKRKDEEAKLNASLRRGDDSISPTTLSFAVSPEPPTEARPLVQELSPRSRPVETSPSPMSKDSSSQQTELGRPVEGPETSTTTRAGVDGIVPLFGHVADFARGGPFDINYESNMQGPIKQRCSETTEGSTIPCSVDCASQATSATTGKMPLSPSTQGTSIVSRDSLDRPNSVPVTTITPSDSTTTAPNSTKSQPELGTHLSHQSHNTTLDDDSVLSGSRSVSTNGTPSKYSLYPTEDGQQNGKTLKKKGSRFRIGVMPFIRRHLSSSPPQHPTESGG